MSIFHRDKISSLSLLCYFLSHSGLQLPLLQPIPIPPPMGSAGAAAAEGVPGIFSPLEHHTCNLMRLSTILLCGEFAVIQSLAGRAGL
jgi:hypothetical protein